MKTLRPLALGLVLGWLACIAWQRSFALRIVHVHIIGQPSDFGTKQAK